ncbi:MAG: hypothetical protein M3410_14255 [Acidobacteriota bacterium]|nr:hypothetical protein [Acidobacteriota bacterium]
MIFINSEAAYVYAMYHSLSIPTRIYEMRYLGPVNRLLLIAHSQPDLCGLKIEVDNLAWTGGYSYLHRSVPLYGSNEEPHRESGSFNYVITFRNQSSAGEKVAGEGDFVLLRLHQNGCVPDADYRWQL